MHQLVCASLQNEPQQRFEPAQRPLVGERRRHTFVEPLAIGGDAAHDLGEQCRVRFAVLVAVDLAAEAVMDELADRGVGAAAGVQPS